MACNFAEIKFQKNKNNYRTINPLTIASLSSKALMSFIIMRYHNTFGISIKKGIDQVVSLASQWFDIKKINIGQDMDIAILQSLFQYQANNTNNLNTKTIIYGVSRGAVTAFNFVATEHPKSVKALICEGIFDSFENLLSYRFPICYKPILKAIEKLTSFEVGEISPLKVYSKLSLNIPVLFIISVVDEIVPFQSTINLYRKLKNMGHNKIHLLILNNSKHNKYTFMNKEDRDLYEYVVHAFYKHYKLPYIKEFASKGQKYFETKTQPNF